MSQSSKKPNFQQRDQQRGKLSEKWEHIKNNRKIEGLYRYTQNNTKDTVAYLLLILGFLLLLFNGFAGGVLIGVVFGVYYAPELLFLFHHLSEFVDEQGTIRSVVLGILLFAFLLAAPGIFVGAALSVALRYFFGN